MSPKQQCTTDTQSAQYDEWMISFLWHHPEIKAMKASLQMWNNRFEIIQQSGTIYQKIITKTKNIKFEGYNEAAVWMKTEAICGNSYKAFAGSALPVISDY